MTQIVAQIASSRAGEMVFRAKLPGKLICFVVVILIVTLLPFAVYLPDDGGQV